MWAVARWPVTGSPPRMRGKGGRVVGRPLDDRITPAYAGKSNTRRSDVYSSQDHPRVCGEKLAGLLSSRTSRGSPPHMRGKGSERYTIQRQYGITPAYAGKSLLVGVFDFLVGDHPRVCGEKGCSACHAKEKPGSPPRMRGKVVRTYQGRRRPGITPAYAGKSFASRYDTPKG